jgi:hypothetical protein
MSNLRTALVLLLASLSFAARAHPTFKHPDRIRFDGHCFTIEGKDMFIFSGAFHYFRCPKELWRERFKLIKEAGFNAVETYVPWNYSEQEKPSGVDDYSHIDLSELDQWLTMAEDEFGLYTIVRPGPYICAEWAVGGFPNWLLTYKPTSPLRSAWYRSDDPVFEAWSRHWMKAVADVVRKHQITQKAKGKHGVILWQVENEYDSYALDEEGKRNYVRSLISDSLDFGIDVPIFSCWTSQTLEPKGDPILSQAFDNVNEYPRWNIDSIPRSLEAHHKLQPDAPKMVTEFQGGWFSEIGGLTSDEQDGINATQINALTLNAIAHGLTGLNYYMLFGGTNFGYWPGSTITTSYDYYAPIREWGGKSAKYFVVKAIGHMLKEYGVELARAEVIPSPFKPGNPDVKVYARKAENGATFLFVRNTSRTEAADGSLGPIAYSLPPFGMNVYRYVGDAAKGSWLVKPEEAKAEQLADPIRLTTAEYSPAEPESWQPIAGGATNIDLGIWDPRFLFYRVHTGDAADRYLWLKTSGGDLWNPAAPKPEHRQGGLGWKTTGSPQILTLFNPGWPNYGDGLEVTRGIQTAVLSNTLPKGKAITGWKAKRISDPSDTSLLGPDVETNAWADGLDGSQYPPHSDVVTRASFQLDEVPDKAVLFCEGVDDEGHFYMNGHLVGQVMKYGVPVRYDVAPYLKQGRNDVAIMIHNNEGAGGLMGDVSIEMPLPPSEPVTMDWTDHYKTGAFSSYKLDANTILPRVVHPKVHGERVGRDSLVVSRIHFPRPDGTAWEVVLSSGGDGFLYLNGHPLGRFWEVGPQRAFYMPSTWLEADNMLEFVAMPGRYGDRIQAAELRQLPMEGAEPSN